MDKPTADKIIADIRATLGDAANGLEMAYQEEQGGYPGGTYWDRQIVVSDGMKTERFDAVLTERNPSVTVGEIQKYFGVSR